MIRTWGLILMNAIESPNRMTWVGGFGSLPFHLPPCKSTALIWANSYMNLFEGCSTEDPSWKQRAALTRDCCQSLGQNSPSLELWEISPLLYKYTVNQQSKLSDILIFSLVRYLFKSCAHFWIEFFFSDKFESS